MRFPYMVAAVAALGLAGCDGGEQGERIELGEPRQEARQGGRADWTPEVTAAVDSGNAAYARQDYDRAAEIFTELTEEQPTFGVAWFGLSMAERARGNVEEAEAALDRAEEYAPGLGRMHDQAEDSMDARRMQMPGGHPPMVMPEDHPPMDGGAGTADGPTGTDG